MPTTAIITGAVLILTGVVGYVATDGVSPTALLPALLGLVLAVLGVVAQRSEGARRQAMHAAVLVALLGALGSLPQFLQLGDALSGTADRPAAAYAGTVTVLVCAVFVALGVRSFIAARRSRPA
jgi:hypothetical protein